MEAGESRLFLPNSKLNEMADYKSEFLDTEDLDWRESPYPGVLWKKLHYDPESGHSTVLLQFSPGAHYGTHRHPQGEEYLVLEGTLQDQGKSYGPGTYVYHPPGSVHRPRSAQGL